MRKTRPTTFFRPIFTSLSLAGMLLLLAGCKDQKQAGAGSGNNASDTNNAVEALSSSGENKLAESTNPFLKRHSTDLIRWRPWGKEAFEEAAKRNKPVLVVLAYSSCPWTAKMQAEVYNDPAAAEVANASTVPVFVDREEQPDVNTALQKHAFITSRRTGWPLHVWLTPEGKPVHASVYMPRVSVGDTPAAITTLRHVESNWDMDPDYVRKEASNQAENFLTLLEKADKGDKQSKLDTNNMDVAYEKMRSQFDPQNGGFSPAPRFPMLGRLEYLLTYAQLCKHRKQSRRQEALQMAEKTMEVMIDRGLRDHLGGGFFRYTLDRGWCVPQHEKMLYDQGLTGLMLADMYSITKNPKFAECLRDLLKYVDTDLGHPSGAFYSGEQGSSPTEIGGKELVEGAYYIWSHNDAKQVCPKDSWPVIEAYYGLTPNGNLPLQVTPISLERYPQMCILFEALPLSEVATRLKLPIEQARKLLEEGKTAMLNSRRLRPRPPRDEKTLPSWNAVAASAFVKAGCLLAEPNWIDRGAKALELTLSKFLASNYARPPYLEDFTLCIQACLDFYEATGQDKWLEKAISLQAKQDEILWDSRPREGGYWDGPERPGLFFRTKSVDETTEFAPNALAVGNLTRLWRLTGDDAYSQRATSVLEEFAGLASATVEQLPAGSLRGVNLPPPVTPPGPSMHTRLLTAYQRYVDPSVTFFVHGPVDSPLANKLRASYRPGSNIFYINDTSKKNPLIGKVKGLEQEIPADATPTILLSSDFKVIRKLTGQDELEALLKELY